MAACMDMKQIQSAMTTLLTNMGLSSEQINYLQQGVAAAHQAQARRDDAINRINNLIANAQYRTGNPSTGQISQTAYAAGRSFIDPDLARSPVDAAKKTQQEILDMVNAADTVGNHGWFLKLSDWLTSRFVTSRSPVYSWAMVYAPTEGRTSGDNPVVRAMRNAESQIMGHSKEMYDSFVKPTIDVIKEIADSIGVDTQELAMEAGMWQIYQHTKERTDYLIDKLTTELQAAVNDPDVSTTTLNSKYAQLSDLLTYYNEADPITDKGDRPYTATGVTPAEAEKLKQEMMVRLGLTESELSNMGGAVRDMYHNVQVYAAEHGLYTPEELAELPDMFTEFVPTMSKAENRMGNASDVTRYNPGDVHAMQGINNAAISDAFSSTLMYVNRVATALGTREMGMALNAVHANGIRTGIANGIERVPYKTIVGRLKSADQSVRAQAERFLNGQDGFVLVSSIPEVDANTGSTVLTKYAFRFDPNWVSEDGSFSGAYLNKAMAALPKQAMGWQAVASATGALASLNTKWSYSFAPINAIRDGGERAFSMYSRSYTTENGAQYMPSLFDISLGYVSAVTKAVPTLINIMRGEVPPTAMGASWRDYVADGLKQDFNFAQVRAEQNKLKNAAEKARLMQQQNANNLMQPKNKGILQAIQKAGIPLVKFNEVVTKWNDFFNNLAPFAQYHMLRSMGVTRAAAREGVLSVMNLRESGMYTDALRTIFPFVKPTMQSAANTLKALGLAPNASGQFQMNWRGLGMLGGQILAFAVLKAALAADMGEEAYDKFSIRDLASYIPLRIGEKDVFKINLPFGPTTLAATTYNVIDRMSRGKMEPEEAAAEMLLSVIRTVTPADLPQFNASANPLGWFAQLITPYIVKPAVEAGFNTSAFGRPLNYAADTADAYTPRHTLGQTSTPDNWAKAAKFIATYFGLDVTPEAIQHFMEGYFVGPLRVITGTINENSLNSMGFDKTTRGVLGPWLSALGATMLYKRIPEGHTTEFYDLKRRNEEKVRKLGINLHKIKADDSEERDAMWRSALEDAGADETTIDTFMSLRAADRELKKIATEYRAVADKGDFLDDPDPKAYLTEYLNEMQDKKEDVYQQVLGL